MLSKVFKDLPSDIWTRYAISSHSCCFKYSESGTWRWREMFTTQTAPVSSLQSEDDACYADHTQQCQHHLNGSLFRAWRSKINKTIRRNEIVLKCQNIYLPDGHDHVNKCWKRYKQTVLLCRQQRWVWPVNQRFLFFPNKCFRENRFCELLFTAELMKDFLTFHFHQSSCFQYSARVPCDYSLNLKKKLN